MNAKWIGIGCGTATLMVAVFGIIRFMPQTGSDVVHFELSENSSTTRTVFIQPIETAAFVDPVRFNAAWSTLSTPTIPHGRVIAGVVNHHVLAADILARFFRAVKLARPDVQRFIIISPDHYGVGLADISTHERPYRVANRLIFIDTTSTKQLITDDFAVLENGGMYELEHGVGALIPFLAHEFPEASVVPLSIRGISDRSKARELGKRLVSLVDEKTFVIISADMSHYLDEVTALKKDELTASWLQSLDSDKFSKANDDFLDNGAAMVALISFFESRRSQPSWTPLDHSISTRYGGPEKNTTSYINGLWSQK